MVPLRMLLCLAHPDDEAFTASGVLAASTARGVQVRLICATYGEEGDIRQPGVATRETLGQVRHQELQRSCAVLGVPLEQIHVRLDVTAYLDQKLASMRCHHTQITPDWTFDNVPREMTAAILGQEYLIQAYPAVLAGTPHASDFLDGLLTGNGHTEKATRHYAGTGDQNP